MQNELVGQEKQIDITQLNTLDDVRAAYSQTIDGLPEVGLTENITNTANLMARTFQLRAAACGVRDAKGSPLSLDKRGTAIFQVQTGFRPVNLATQMGGWEQMAWQVAIRAAKGETKNKSLAEHKSLLVRQQELREQEATVCRISRLVQKTFIRGRCE